MPAAVSITATKSIQGIFDIINEVTGNILDDKRILSGLQILNGDIVNKHLNFCNYCNSFYSYLQFIVQ